MKDVDINHINAKPFDLLVVNSFQIILAVHISDRKLCCDHNLFPVPVLKRFAEDLLAAGIRICRIKIVHAVIDRIAYHFDRFVFVDHIGAVA